MAIERGAWMATTGLVALVAGSGLTEPSMAQAGEEIVVTVQRRAQKIQETPLSVTSLKAETLEDLGIVDSENIARLVPNVQIALPFGRGNQPVIAIRGIGLNDFNTNNAGPIGIYVDEVYLSAPSSQSFALFDLARVEVLKGPQGTLYGFNTTGGAINYITAQPTDIFEAGLRASYASYNTFHADAFVSGPLADRVQGRIALSVNNSDSYLRNVTTRRKDHGGADDYSWRIQLRTELSDTFTVLWNVHGGKVDTLPAEAHVLGAFTLASVISGAPSVCSNAEILAQNCVNLLGFGGPTGAPTGLYDIASQRTAPLEVENLGGSIRADYEAGDLNLVSISAFERNEKLAPNDGDGSPIRFLEADYGVESETFTQEVRLSQDRERFNWVAGASYLHEELKQSQFIAVAFDLHVDGFTQAGDVHTDQETDTFAVFGQGDYKLTDELTVTLGARQTWYKRDYNFDLFYQVQAGGVLPPLAFLYNLSTPTDAPSIDDTFTSGRVALSYQMTPGVMLYGSIATSFKGGNFLGGFLSSIRSDAVVQFRAAEPETVVAYEVGLKSAWSSNRVIFNLAAFYYDYSDMQVFNLLPPLPGGTFTIPVLDNADEATMKGIEAELILRPIDNMTISLSAAYLDAELGTYVSGGGTGLSEDFSGNTLPLAPEFSFAGLIDYAIPLKNGGEIGLQISSSYRSGQFFDARNDPLLHQDGYWLFDARIGYAAESANWEIALVGRNLADEEYITYGLNSTSPFGTVGYFAGPRRVVGAELVLRY